MDHDLRIALRLEYGALARQAVAQLSRVGERAVMRQGHAAVPVVDEDGLCITEAGATGRGVAHVADRQVSLEVGEDLVVEGLADVSHALVGARFAVGVDGYDSGRFLAPVLQGIQSKERQFGRPLDSTDREDAALVPQAIVVPPGGQGPVRQVRHQNSGSGREVMRS